MKIMAFVDTHGDTTFLRKLIQRAKKEDIDIVVCAGDFTVFENQINGVLKELDGIGKTVLIIPGNHESAESVERYTKKFSNIVNLHKQMWKKDDVAFIGWGTDGFTRHSDEFRELQREWRRMLTPNQKVVLVTHAPPYKTNLDKIGNDYVGNADIRKGIERIQPILAIAGHIHENEGKQDRIGKTVCVNPGWKGMVLAV